MPLQKQHTYRVTDNRQRYSPELRARAAQMYIHQHLAVADIAEQIGAEKATVQRWCWEDRWIQTKKEFYADTDIGNFAQTMDFLMRTINRMSQRLYESTMLNGDEASDFVLPDENLELRINRLTLALERIFPMGNFVRTRQRVDVVKEIKQLGFDSVANGVFKDEEMMIVFRLLEQYLTQIEKPDKFGQAPNNQTSTN